MKRAISLLVATGLLFAGTSSVSAGSPQKRTVSAEYQTPVLGVRTQTVGAYYFDCLHGIGCAIIPLGKKDRSVRLEIKDVTGGTVHGEVYLMPGGHHYATICGSSRKLPLAYGSELVVHVAAGTCDEADGSAPSTATRGTVEATLSSKSI